LVDEFRSAFQWLLDIDRSVDGAKMLRVDAALSRLRRDFTNRQWLSVVARRAGFSVPAFVPTVGPANRVGRGGLMLGQRPEVRGTNPVLCSARQQRAGELARSLEEGATLSALVEGFKGAAQENQFTRPYFWVYSTSGSDF
jgi:hypothetical protein